MCGSVLVSLSLGELARPGGKRSRGTGFKGMLTGALDSFVAVLLRNRSRLELANAVKIGGTTLALGLSRMFLDHVK